EHDQLRAAHADVVDPGPLLEPGPAFPAALHTPDALVLRDRKSSVGRNQAAKPFPGLRAGDVLDPDVETAPERAGRALGELTGAGREADRARYPATVRRRGHEAERIGIGRRADASVEAAAAVGAAAASGEVERDALAAGGPVAEAPVDPAGDGAEQVPASIRPIEVGLGEA